MSFMKKTFDRAKQTVGEKLLDVAKTELEPELNAQIFRSEVIKNHVEKILTAIESYVPVEGGIKIPGLNTSGAENKPEHVAQAMTNFVVTIEKWDTKTASQEKIDGNLRSGAIAFTEIGKLERQFVAEVTEKLTNEVKKFLNEEVKSVENEKKLLHTKRVDMDSLRNRHHKTPQDEKLKTEMDASIQDFDQQKEKLKEALINMEQKLASFGDSLRDFAQANAAFFSEGQKILENWQKQM